MTTITTLIPAYRPDYLGEVFLGLKTQHLRDFRVVLSDDSPGGAITDAIRRGVWDALIDGFEMVVVPGPRAGAFATSSICCSSGTARRRWCICRWTTT